MIGRRIAVARVACVAIASFATGVEETPDGRVKSVLAAVAQSCQDHKVSPGHGHKVLPVAQAILRIRDRFPQLKDADPPLCQVAALLHDIGGGGPPGETKGPPIARQILKQQKCDPAVIDAVCRIIATHHHLSGEVDVPIAERPAWLIVIVADRPDVIRHYESAPADAESLERDVKAWLAKLDRTVRWNSEL